MSLRDAILTADDRKTEAVEVPEWGTTVYLRPMSGLERDQWEAKKVNNNASWAGALLASTLCEADGARSFTLADAEALGNKNGAAIVRLTDAAMRVNGMGRTARESKEGNS
jgi:hypothetical protein